MPRHIQLMKDAVNGETPRGVVNRQRSGDIRMGEPGTSNVVSLPAEAGKKKPRELKHLSTWRKRKQTSDSVSSGERTRKRPNRSEDRGCRTATWNGA